MAFLVSRPGLALLPRVKKRNETLHREKDRSIWKLEGVWVGMAIQAGKSGSPPKSALGTAPQIGMGRMTVLDEGWYCSKMQVLCPVNRKGCLHSSLSTASLLPTSPALLRASAPWALRALREDNAAGRCPSSPPSVKQSSDSKNV